MITDKHSFNNDTELLAKYKNGTIDPAKGRKLFRHPNGKGTVIAFDLYNKDALLFVPDAAYRPQNANWGMYAQNVSELDQFTLDCKPMSNAGKKTMSLVGVLSDTEIQSEFPSFKTDKTAKENTDILMKYNSPAARSCRNLDVGLGPMDLPNIYELMMLYQEADNIDKLDPTFAANKDSGLGHTSTYGRFDARGQSTVWSSTSYSDKYSRSVFYDGNTDYSYRRRDTDAGVVPVLEIFNTPESNRKLYRHSNNKGTVIEYTDWNGRQAWMFVADAQYRAMKQWGGKGQDIGALHNNQYSGFQLSGVADDAKLPLCYMFNDPELRSKLGQFRHDTAANQTNAIVNQLGNGAQAAKYCKDMSIDSIADLDLPNVYQMAIIYLEADRLDEMDPTVAQHSGYALGYKSPSGRLSSKIYWTSTECNNNLAWGVTNSGNLFGGGKDAVFAVVPVKEFSSKP